MAPATLLSATTVTFQDVDGNDVTAKLSMPLLNPGRVNDVFLFDSNNVNGSNAAPSNSRPST